MAPSLGGIAMHVDFARCEEATALGTYHAVRFMRAAMQARTEWALAACGVLVWLLARDEYPDTVALVERPPVGTATPQGVAVFRADSAVPDVLDLRPAAGDSDTPTTGRVPGEDDE